MSDSVSAQPGLGASDPARRFLAWIAGLVIGIGAACLLFVLMLPPLDTNMDPRSMRGVGHALSGAGLALIAGWMIAFLPRSISRTAVATTVGLLAVYGLTGMALSREYFLEMVLGFVMAPSCALGAAFADRRRSKNLDVAPPPGG